MRIVRWGLLVAGVVIVAGLAAFGIYLAYIIRLWNQAAEA